MSFSKWSEKKSGPVVTIWHYGIFVFNKPAIDALDLEHCAVELWFDDNTGQMALSSSPFSCGEGKRAYLRRSSANLSAKGFLVEHGMLPAYKVQYRLTPTNDLDPGGFPLWVLEPIREEKRPAAPFLSDSNVKGKELAGVPL